MTREEARHWLEIELKTWEDECKSKHPIKEALSVAIKALEKEPILDKIRAEIEQRRQRYDGAMYYIEAAREQELSWVLEVIDQYKQESEE